MASILGIPHAGVHVDVLAGHTRTPTFLALNPNGKVPLPEIGDGRHLTESNAILNYLAAGTDLLPTEHFGRAKVLL